MVIFSCGCLWLHWLSDRITWRTWSTLVRFVVDQRLRNRATKNEICIRFMFYLRHLYSMGVTFTNLELFCVNDWSPMTSIFILDYILLIYQELHLCTIGLLEFSGFLHEQNVIKFGFSRFRFREFTARPSTSLVSVILSRATLTPAPFPWVDSTQYIGI